MKKNKRIGDLLGIKQEDMAMLLKISRVTWAMYVTGKRNNLPSGSKLKVAEMLVFVKQLDEDNRDKLTPVKKVEPKIKKSLQQQLIVNKYKQGAVAAKLETAQEKYESACNAYQLVDFLAAKQEVFIYESKILQEIKDKAGAAIEKNGLHIQEQFEIKLLVLEQEELLLKERLSRYD